MCYDDYTCNRNIFDLSAGNHTKLYLTRTIKILKNVFKLLAIFALLHTCTCTEYLNKIFCSFVNTNICTFCFVFLITHKH